MKVLVVGGGGREHAIVWKLKQSPKIDKIYCAPGNAGISKDAECVHIGAMEMEKLIAFAKEQKIDFTIIGMDDPLVAGIVDAFEAEGLKVFGPRKNAAVIEGSKAFSKELMKKYGIPTAKYEIFDDYDKAKAYVLSQPAPIVVKADGLALGKGVLICQSHDEAVAALDEIMVDKKFGKSGNKVVIEECLSGPEVSVLSFCDGKTVVPMVSAQDHKRAYDNDEGLNTGGMGTFSPSRIYTKELNDECMKTIFQPTVDAMAEEGRTFVGILYFGLMLTKDGMKVIEYNARFGDPETQVILPRLKTDLLDIMEHCVDGTLDKINIEWDDNACVCVVLASGGYPVEYKKGYEITGLEEAEKDKNIVIFHAGTAIKDGKFVTNGGRILGITALGKDIDDARETAYAAVDKVNFEKKHFRHDIGIKKY
ncbi:MAG: phosphoribosylamine--glycine ligase [Clostridia bacterium]|jgi:phosphoribosylamine--glycine ligase|nr:phosphoribosylamine--glycine ligase [Clostridia bacterium]MCI2014697.1 phosphoribosylamine--glycine ligase [Clostridia bacterium]